MTDHSVFTRPECRCERCMAVYDEWAKQAEGFQGWLEQVNGVSRIETGDSRAA